MTYEFRALRHDSGEMEKLLALFKQVWPDGGHLTREYIEWQYWANPAGQVVGVNAWAGDELAGHYVTIPRNGEWGGSVHRGLLSLNTAVSPSHQGKGLFVKLAAQTYETGAQLGCEFVIGVANANSVHGFVSRLGFRHCGQLDVRIAVGLPRTVAPGDGRCWSGDWTREHYEWRLACPARRYSHRASRDGKTVCVFSDVRKMGMSALVKIESRPEFVDYLTGKLPRSGAAPFFWFGNDADRFRFGAASVAVPHRFQRPPLHLIWRDLGSFAKPADSPILIEPLDFDLV